MELENKVAEEQFPPMKISQEVAEEQFQSFFDNYFIDPDDIETENGEASVKTIKNTVIRAIKKGYVSIETSGVLSIRQKLMNPVESKGNDITEFVFQDKLGPAGIARDKAGKVDTMRMNAFMGALGDTSPVVFSRLKGGDMTIYTRIAMLFSLV